MHKDTTTLTFCLPPPPDARLSPKDIKSLSDSALRSLLADHRKALGRLDDIWAMLQPTLNHVRALQEEYKSHQRLLLDRIAPVDLLPNEVLATIFAYVVQTRECQPVVLWKHLTHVCQRWRRVAQHTTQVIGGQAFTFDGQNLEHFDDLPARLWYRCSIPGEFTLKISLHLIGPRPLCKDAIPELIRFLAAPHKAAISLTLDDSTAVHDTLCAKLFVGSTTKFLPVAQLTLRTPGHAIEGAEAQQEGVSNDKSIEFPALRTLWFQSSLVDFATIQHHRSWLFRPENAQGIRSLTLDHVTGGFLRHLLPHLTHLNALRVGRLVLTEDQEGTGGHPDRHAVTTYRLNHPTLEHFAIILDPFDVQSFNLSINCPSLSTLCISNIEPSFVKTLYPALITSLNIHAVNLPAAFTSMLAQFVSLGRLQLNGINHEDFVELTNSFTRHQDPLFPSLWCLVATYRGSTLNASYDDKGFNEKLELPKELGRLTAPRASGASPLRAFHLRHLGFVTSSDLRYMVGVLNGWEMDTHRLVQSFDEDMKKIFSYLDEKSFNFETLNNLWTSFTNKYQDVEGTFLMATATTRKDGSWDGDYLHNQIWFLVDRVHEVFLGTKYIEGPWKSITEEWKKAFWKACGGKGWMISQAAECVHNGGKLASTVRYDGLYYGERMGSLVADSWFRDEELGFHHS